jgi:hypothetical protein
MAEPELFERRVADALRTYAAEMPARVDAAAVADRVAGERARREWHIGGGLAAVPRFAWALLLAGLLLALVVGGLAGGLLWERDRAIVTRPSPTATLIVGEVTILATTKAHPLPAQATCPPGSDPDVPGPAGQESPTSVHVGGAMAFDRHAGRIVVLTQVGTWTYDVCANTWQLMNPPEEPRGGWGSPAPIRLVYDADSDRTLAFADPDIWSYELAADQWTRVGSLPVAADGAPNVTYGTTFYHDPSGLVVHYDGTTMWAYDVETSTLTEVPQRPDSSLSAGSGLPLGKITLGYDPRHDLVVAVVAPFAEESRKGVPARFVVPANPIAQTWTFDPGTGSWRREASPAASDLIVCGVWWTGSTDCYQTYGRSVFDEASGLTVFISRDEGPPPEAPRRADVYDADQRAWRTLHESTGAGASAPRWCDSTPPVYDPINRRIVCVAGPDRNPEYHTAGVSAFSTATGEWRWLFEPQPVASPTP